MRSSPKGRTTTNVLADAIDYPSVVVDSADMSMVSDMDGRYRYVSPACFRLFGWEPEALEGHHEDEFVHPHDLPLLHADRASLARSEFVSTNYRFLCRDGTTRMN